MRRWLIAGIVLVVIAGSLLLVLRNLDSYLERNRDWLARRAEALLGRSVAFDDIGVSLSGGIGVRVNNLRIMDDPSFSDGELVGVERATVVAELLPALVGRFEVRRVDLEAPRVTLIRDENRRFNFESIGKPEKDEPEGAGRPSEPGPSTPETGIGALPLVAAELAIRNGSLRFVDRSTTSPVDFTVGDIDLSVSGAATSKPARLRASATVLGAEHANVDLSGTIGPLDAANPSALPLDLRVAVDPLVLDRLAEVDRGAVLPTGLSAPDPVRLAASVGGTVDAPRLAATFDATSTALAWDTSFFKPAGATFTLSIEGTERDGGIDVQKLTAKLGDLEISGSGRIAGGSSGTSLEIDAPDAPLAKYTAFVPALRGVTLAGYASAHIRAATPASGETQDLRGTIELKDVAVAPGIGSLRIDGLSTTVRLEGGSAVVEPTDVRVSGIPVHVGAKVESLAQPTVQLSVRAPELPAAALGVEKKPARDTILRDVVFDGAIHLSRSEPGMFAALNSPRGQIGTLEYRDLRIAVSLQGAILLLRRFEVDTRDGSLVARGQYDTGTDPPEGELQTTVRDIDVTPLLALLSGDGGPGLGGRMRARIALRGAGKDRNAITASLSGGGEVRIEDGVIENVNLAESVLRGVTGVSGLSGLLSPKVRQRHPGIFSTGNTRFDSLTATIDVGQRKVTTDDLRLEAPDYTVRGAGSIGFDQRADLHATLVASTKLTQNLLGRVKDGRALTNGDGRLEIPFRLKGKLPDVSLKVDPDFIARTLQKALLGGGLNQLLRPKKKKGSGPSSSSTEELIEKGLKSLFGR